MIFIFYHPPIDSPFSCWRVDPNLHFLLLPSGVLFTLPTNTTPRDARCIAWQLRPWRCFPGAEEQSSSPPACGFFCHCYRRCHRRVSLAPPTVSSTSSASTRSAPFLPLKPTTTAASSPSSPESTSPSAEAAAPTPLGPFVATNQLFPFFLQIWFDHLLNWFVVFVSFVCRLYYAKIGIGTPPKNYYLQVDTGTDIMWVNCIQCKECPTRSSLGVSFSSF